MKITAIIPAAGKGKRISQGNKLLIPLAGRPILAWTVEVFENHPFVEEIVLLAAQEDIKSFQELVKKYRFSKVGQVLPGGEERQDSVFLGLSYLEGAEWVAVHDGARPLITKELLDKVFLACEEEAEGEKIFAEGSTGGMEFEVEGVRATTIYPSGYMGRSRFGGAILGYPAYETLKKVDENNWILSTLQRNEIWIAHTPQVFPYHILFDAHRKARESQYYATDDAALVERLGFRIKIVQSSAENIKITTADDIAIAEVLLKNRQKESEKMFSKRKSS